MTKTVTGRRAVPVIHETEVLVVAWTGGLAAALASARSGADTTLLERFIARRQHHGCWRGGLRLVRHENTVEAVVLVGARGTRQGHGCGRAGEPIFELRVDSEGFKLVADALVREAAFTLCFTVSL